jgi:hypothetical protein
MANQMHPKLYCTMKNSIDLCNIKKTNVRGNEYKKFPKLVELYEKIFGCQPSGLHNSLVDVYACLRCYLSIKNEGDQGKDLEVMNRMNSLENISDFKTINQENLNMNMEDGL